MKTRRIGPFEVSAIGLGCMNVVHGYNPAIPRDDAIALLRRALDLGCTHFDTAAIYGLGKSEELIRDAIMGRRQEFFLASKCGIVVDAEGRRLDGTPKGIRQVCEASLKRLGAETIDLYYLHRLDRRVPVEESVGALGELVREGKIGSVGLSEVSGATLRRACREYPVVAVQNEYSLWTRNPEIALLEACKETGATLVAFSPLGRAFLTGRMPDPASFHETDMRRSMPRFEGGNLERNRALLEEYKAVARGVGCSPAQLALAWVLSRGEHVVAIPGTSSMSHLEENMEADAVELSAAVLASLDELINERTVSGPRYPAFMQADVDTEDFEAEQA